MKRSFTTSGPGKDFGSEKKERKRILFTTAGRPKQTTETMPYRNAVFDDNLEIPSAKKSTVVTYSRRLLKCICCLLVLITIIVTATAVGCSILVYEHVFGKSLKEDFREVEATRAVPMTDAISATVTFTTMSAYVVPNTGSVTTGGPINSFPHVSTNGVPTDKLRHYIDYIDSHRMRTE